MYPDDYRNFRVWDIRLRTLADDRDIYYLPEFSSPKDRHNSVMYYHGSRGHGDYDSYDSKDVQIDMDTRFRDSSDWQIFDKDTIYHKPSGLRFDVFYHVVSYAVPCPRAVGGRLAPFPHSLPFPSRGGLARPAFLPLARLGGLRCAFIARRSAVGGYAVRSPWAAPFPGFPWSAGAGDPVALWRLRRVKPFHAHYPKKGNRANEFRMFLSFFATYFATFSLLLISRKKKFVDTL